MFWRSLPNDDVKFSHLRSWGLFLEGPETFRAYFGWHNSLCIFKTEASRGTKLRSYFYFYSLYNIWKDQLCRISRTYFYEWLFGHEKFSGLSRNGPLMTRRVRSSKFRSLPLHQNHPWQASEGASRLFCTTRAPRNNRITRKVQF